MANVNKIISDNIDKIIVSKEPSKAQIERGVGMLSSVKIVVNVLYALMIFQAFLILPRPDDPELQIYSLSQLFSENMMVLLVILVGLIMIIIYWMQFNRQMGNLVRSTPIHASISILQMVCLMIYLYFLRFDLELDGLEIALQMESVFLALAGFLGAFNWMYAKKNNLTSNQIDKAEERAVLFQLLPEPIAAVFSLPFASLGSGPWSIAFLIVFPLGYVFKKLGKKKQIN